MKDWRNFHKRVHHGISQIAGLLIDIRRDFHAHPELAFQEIRTARRVAEWLARYGVEVQTGVAKTGVVGRVSGYGPGPTVALRADMDGLPIQDEKQVSYKSQVPGRMHACGHDAHTTMLMGAACILSEMRREWPGHVVFLFQPAEEGPGGALPMIEEGVLEGVDVIFAQHVTPGLEPGYVAIADGPMFAAIDDFCLTVYGEGGHAAYPHLAVDAIQIAGQVIAGLQPLLSRQVDPLQSAVVTIGTIEGGRAENIIADQVVMRGTIRTLDPLLRKEIPRRMEAIAKGIASAYGGRISFTLRSGYPSLINTPREVQHVSQVAEWVMGKGHVLSAPPSMGGEDFAYYLEKRPGCMWWLGAMHPKASISELSLHHPRFDMDEGALNLGVEMLVMNTLAYLFQS